MNQGDLEVRVIALVGSELGLPESSVTATTDSNDVDKWDSLGHLQICMALEAEFGVSPGLTEIAELDSVPAIVNYLRQSL